MISWDIHNYGRIDQGDEGTRQATGEQAQEGRYSARYRQSNELTGIGST